MANIDAVRGLIPVQHINGAPWNGQTRRFYKAAATSTAIMVGDMVIMSGSGDAFGVAGVDECTAGDGNASVGVVTSIVPDGDNLGRTYIAAADAGYVNVCCDPNVLFEAQANDTLTYTDLGNNAPMVKTSVGSTTTGNSGMELNATVATDATNQLKVIELVQRHDNAINAANNKYLVLINNHQFRGGTGTVGID